MVGHALVRVLAVVGVALEGDVDAGVSLRVVVAMVGVAGSVGVYLVEAVVLGLIAAEVVHRLVPVVALVCVAMEVVAGVGPGLDLGASPVVLVLVVVAALLVLVLVLRVQVVSVYERLGCGTICTCARHYCAVVDVGGLRQPWIG